MGREKDAEQRGLDNEDAALALRRIMRIDAQIREQEEVVAQIKTKLQDASKHLRHLEYQRADALAEAHRGQMYLFKE